MGSHTTIDGGSPVTVVTGKTSKMFFGQTEAEDAWCHNGMVVLLSRVLSRGWAEVSRMTSTAHNQGLRFGLPGIKNEEQRQLDKRAPYEDCKANGVTTYNLHSDEVRCCSVPHCEVLKNRGGQVQGHR